MHDSQLLTPRCKHARIQPGMHENLSLDRDGVIAQRLLKAGKSGPAVCQRSMLQQPVTTFVARRARLISHRAAN